jgi:hypothetical protein
MKLVRESCTTDRQFQLIETALLLSTYLLSLPISSSPNYISAYYHINQSRSGKYNILQKKKKKKKKKPELFFSGGPLKPQNSIDL